MLWEQSAVSEAGADLLAGPPSSEHRDRFQNQLLPEEQQDPVHRWQRLSDDEEDIQEVH